MGSGSNVEKARFFKEKSMSQVTTSPSSQSTELKRVLTDTNLITSSVQQNVSSKSKIFKN